MRAKRIGVFLLVAGAVFLCSLTQLRDWDAFYHLAYGRDLLRRGGFATEDPFLYPLAGHPSGAQLSWLGSLVIYLSWLVAGDSGPVYLAGLMGSVLFVLLLVDGLGDDDTPEGWAIALLPLVFALAVFRERAVARPELFSNVLLVWTLIALRRHAADRGRFLLAFPVVAVLWVNLHQSVLVGVAVLVMFTAVNGGLLVVRRLGGRLPSEVSGARALVAPAGAALGGLVAAALLNPAGPAQLLSPINFILAVVRRPAGTDGALGADPLSLLSRMVIELRPPTPSQWLGPFGWLVVLCAVSFLLAWSRVNLREAAMCAAFVYLAANAQRFMALAVIVMAPITARNLRAVLAMAPVARSRLVRWGVVGVGAVGIAAAAWNMFQVPDTRFGTGLARQVPARSVAYLRSIGFRGRLFSTFHFGGYLEWTLDQKVFQDGRGHLLPGDAAAAFAGPGAYAKFEALDRRYRFEALVTHYRQVTDADFKNVTAGAAGADWGADRTTWALVAFDDGGLVYLRRDGVYAAFAARDEYRYAMPANSLALPPFADRAHVNQDLERSLREVPDCLRCRTMLGLLLNEAGRTEEAEAMFLPAIEGRFETRLFALMGLARAAEARGDRVAAASRWRRIIEIAPDPSWSRRQLAGVLLRDGRPGDAWFAIRKNLGSARETADDLELGIRIAQARLDGAAVWELTARLAIARATEQAEEFYGAGRAFMRSGDLQEAIAALSRALQLNERAPAPHFTLAQAYELRGDARRAETEYRRYLELEPAGPSSQEARERLAKLQGASRR